MSIDVETKVPESLLIKLSEFLDPKPLDYWVKRIPAIMTIPGHATKFNRIEEAKSKEELADYLAELRYALIFKKLGYLVTMEPEGDKGPDLKIEKEAFVAFVEVTRFRPTPELQKTYEISSDLADDIEVVDYASVENCIQKVYSKVTNKFNQVADFHAILAIWNDSEAIDHSDMPQAIKNIISIDDGSVLVPKNLNTIIFGSFESNEKQFYCFKMKLNVDEATQSFFVEMENSRLGKI
ncbi:hypothetical protein [Geomonas anaerohicana]|uniref:Uncharacterized protein n=1 Tax=Geomonas anaerohicana TaxID=2798583 RepID=A0ABS0YK93_9BACT|nr:hypothetical protein [Geomonas anaerohicana]MBJ6752677.1 hypothetical protein [Geomonas anaerohicana]